MIRENKHEISTKDNLRKKYLKIRKGLSEKERITLSFQLLKTFKEFIDSKYLNNVHVFMPIEKQNEVNTEPFLIHLLERKIEVIFSKSDLESSNMSHFIYDDTMKFSMNKWGIKEPISGALIEEEKIDMVLVPLIAFDKLGHRIGYGKGYYDKFLSLCKPNCIKIGLSLLEPINVEIPSVAADIKLDYCISPSGLHAF